MQAYMRLMNRRPLLGPCITTAALFATGDMVAQQGVDKRGLSNHDWVRTARLGVYGGGVFAPLVVKWHVLDQIPIKSKPVLVASRVALDQFVFAPFAVALFFGCTTLMEGKSVDDVRHKLRTSYKDTLIANWGLFVPFQTINMAFVPLQHRLLAVNAVNIPWNAFLSLKAASKPIPGIA